MELTVATHFGQGGDYGERHAERLIGLIADSGAGGIRDGLSWALVERAPGLYDFSDFRAGYLGRMAEAELDVTLTLTPGRNSLYDDGATVTSDAGIAAFARFVATVAETFPEVDRVVIGNEFNTMDARFVSGPAATRSLSERAEIYTRILEAVRAELAATDAEIELVGGALHSVATGYVAALIDTGAVAGMDAIDLHPYGLRPEETGQALDRLNDILSALPDADRPKLVVTEFGKAGIADDPLTGAVYLAKMAAVMGAGGVASASWYALLDEDHLAHADMGLFDPKSGENPVFSAYRFIADLVQESPEISRVDTAPGIEAYVFGPDTMLVWGSAQEVAFTGTDLVFRDAAGRVIDRPVRLGADPVFVQGKGIALRPQTEGALLADSFYDFALTPDPDGPWSYVGEKIMNGTHSTFGIEVMDGQTRMDELWNPYLGNTWSRPFFLTADTILPANFGDPGQNQRNAVERFTAEAPGLLDIVGSWSLPDASGDGVVVEVRLNSTVLFSEVVTEHHVLALRGVTVAAGDTLDFVVQANMTAIGDVTTRHIRVFDHSADLRTQALLRDHLKGDIIDGNDDLQATVLDLSPNLGDLLNGSRRGDDLGAGAGDDTLIGLAGRDTLRGEAGDDLLLAGAGRDVVIGGRGGDTMYGGAHDDRLVGQAGRDHLRGGGGDDALFGGGGRDMLRGGRGDDTLKGGAGADLLIGGDGADHFVLTPNGRDRIADFDPDQGDILDLRAFGVTVEAITFLHDDGDLKLLIASDQTGDYMAVLRHYTAEIPGADNLLF